LPHHGQRRGPGEPVGDKRGCAGLPLGEGTAPHRHLRVLGGPTGRTHRGDHAVSYSIANGIGVGFIAWVVLRTAAGNVREISPLLWIVAAGFLIYFARNWIESLIGL
jgi:hypothetical protein